MLKAKYCVFVVLVGFVLSAAAEVRLAVINTERVLRESEPAKKASAKLEKEFKKRSQDLDKLRQQIQAMQEDMDKNGTTMAESVRASKARDIGDLTRELQRKQREYNEDVNARRNEELQSILERTNGVIRSVAEKDNLDLVVQEAVYANPRIDITDKVIKALSEPAPSK